MATKAHNLKRISAVATNGEHRRARQAERELAKVQRELTLTKKAIGPLPDDSTFMLPMRLLLGDQNNVTCPLLQNTWVYACTVRIMRNIGALDFRVLERGQDPTKARNDLPVLDRENPLVKLFTDYNPNINSANEFWELLTAYLVLEGEAFVVTEMPGRTAARRVDETPGELWLYSGRFFKPVLKNGVVQGWMYSPNGASAQGQYYAVDQIIQFRFPNPYNPLRGLSFISALSLSLDQEFLLQLYNKAFFENGGDPGGMLVFPDRMDDKIKKTVLAMWNARHKGPKNAKKTGIIDAGGKYESIDSTHQSMGWLDQRKWNRDEVLAAMGVPKAEVALYEDVNFATAAEASRSFWEKTLIPIVKVIQNTLDRRLFTKIDGGKYRGAFDLKQIRALQEDLKDQAAGAKALIDTGVAPNEARRHAGMEIADQPWGMEPLVQPNLRRISLVAAAEDLPTIGGTPGSDGAGPGKPAPGSQAGDGGGNPQPAGSGDVGPLPDLGGPGAGGHNGSDSARNSIEARGVAADRKLAGWRAVLKTVLEPNEQPMHSKLRSYVYQLRAEQLKQLEKATKAMDLPAMSTAVRAKVLTLDSRTAGFEGYPMDSLIGNPLMAPAGVLDPLIDSLKRELQEWEIDALVLFNRQKWDAKLQAMTRPIYTSTALDATKSVEAELGGLFIFDATDPRVIEFMQRKEMSLLSVNDTLTKNIRSALVQGLANQEGYQEMSERLKQVFNFSTSKTFQIARTEVAQAANGVRALAFEAEGVEKQEWSTAGDEKVRVNHQLFGSAPAQRLDFNWLTLVGEPGVLTHACDERGPASEVISCRCVMLARRN